MTDRLVLLAENIKRANSLYALHHALIDFEAAQAEDVQFDVSPCADNTESALKSHGVDICKLPTFGGPEPASTCEVWSWDEDSLLVGVGPFAEWEVRDRPTETEGKTEPMAAWRAIANAPKDGTRILLTDGKFVGSGAWREVRLGRFQWDIDGEQGDTCPWANDYMGDVVGWMPLPTPMTGGWLPGPRPRKEKPNV
jgi:hypothetical protein